jgi:hypothetical protein
MIPDMDRGRHATSGDEKMQSLRCWIGWLMVNGASKAVFVEVRRTPLSRYPFTGHSQPDTECPSLRADGTRWGREAAPETGWCSAYTPVDIGIARHFRNNSSGENLTGPVSLPSPKLGCRWAETRICSENRIVRRASRSSPTGLCRLWSRSCAASLRNVHALPTAAAPYGTGRTRSSRAGLSIAILAQAVRSGTSLNIRAPPAGTF